MTRNGSAWSNAKAFGAEDECRWCGRHGADPSDGLCHICRAEVYAMVDDGDLPYGAVGDDGTCPLCGQESIGVCEACRDQMRTG